MQDFTGRTAVITGGASGIGLALARRFAAEGMRVVLGDVEAPALAQAEHALRAEGAEVRTAVTDVTDPAQVEALAELAVREFDAVHVFCNNAGVGGGGLSWEVPLAEWEWVLGVNLWGVIHGLRTFVPLLMQHDDAHLVNTASVAGLVSAPFMGPYNASKHAVVAISESLYHEQQMHGGAVKVHVVCPGWVQTRIAESDRNRPEHLGGPGPRADDAVGGAARETLQAVLAEGMHPDEVAGKVVDAMRAGRFWILTHDDDQWRRAIDALHSSVRDQTNPVFTGLV